MILKNIKLKNIGAHIDTEIGLEAFEGIIPITGHNGSGKTFLLESIPALFYGAFPTRQGSLYDQITDGSDGRAQIEASFRMGGRDYRAVKDIKKKGKQQTTEARLFEMDGEGKEVMIGGGKVSEYQKVISGIIGEENTFLASVFSSQKNTGDLCDAKPSERKEIFSKLLGFGRLDKYSEIAKEMTQKFGRMIEMTEEKVSAMQPDIANIEPIEAELKSIENEISKLTGEAKEKEERINDLNKIINKNTATIEKVRTARERIEAIDREITRLESQMRDKEKEVKELSGLRSRVFEITNSYKRLSELRTRSDKLVEDQRKFQEFQKRLAVMEADLKAVREEYQRAYNQAALIEKIPNQECCKTCFLADSAYKCKNEVVLILDEGKAKKKEKEDLIITIPSFDQKEYDSVRQEISELSKCESEYTKLQSAENAARVLQCSIDELGEQITDKQSERSVNINMIKDNEEAEKTQLRFTGDLIMFKREHDEWVSLISSMQTKKGQYTERLSTLKKNKKTVEQALKAIEGTKKELKIWEALAVAFGRYGIQPLIIDSARPEIESIADELLKLASDGHMSIRFETQKELKGGGVAESLDILIMRDGFEKDIADFSGGEQKLLKTIIRLTLSIYQSLHGGKRLKTIFIDEVFDDLDYENSEKLLKVFQRLREYFKKIIVISHNDDLLQTLPNGICLTKTSNGTQVEILK